MSNQTLDHRDMTGQQLRELAKNANESIQLDVARIFEKAALADACITVAADMLDRGEYTHALQLCRRAGEVHSSYSALHSALGGGDE